VPCAALLVLAMFGLVGLVFVWEWLQLPGSIMWRPRRTLERAQERRRRASTADLLTEARAAIRSERWDQLAAGRALLDGGNDRWTDDTLLRALEALLAAVNEDDRVHGRSGRASGYFEFHDCGLASICEALADRLENSTQASDSTRGP